MENPKPKTQNPKPTSILLTGATGFLGSHLLEALLKNHYQVVVVKRSFSDTWRIVKLLDQVRCYDLDKVSLEKPFEENRIDVVIHTATHYGRNNDLASKIVETNTLFPLKLLETAIHFNIDTFFNTDTLLYKYLNHYALSKKQFAEWLQSFCEQDKIKGVNLKVEHMYGAKDDPKKFVPWLVQQLTAGVERIPLTKGEQQRDFIHVADVVSAFLLLIDNHQELGQFSEFELGAGSAVRVKDFVREVKAVHDKIKNFASQTMLDFGSLPYRQGESMEIQAAISKLQALGWQPVYDFKRGLRQMLSEEIL